MILVLTPLPLEFDALSSAWGGPLHKQDVGGVRVTSAEKISFAVGGHGKVRFALTAQHLIRELRPRLVVGAGACGALVPELALLDVVAATETVEHDYRLRFVKRPDPAFAGCAKTLQRLRTMSFDSFALHFGKMASGDEDVIEEGRAGEIRTQTQALAVAWEGAGLARAAEFTGVPFLELRTVTDTAGPSAPRDFADNVRQGMVNVAEVLRALL